MGPFQLSSESASVVVVGSLNPAIIQPAWLAKYEIVAEAEAKSAQINIINDDISIIQFGSLLVEAQRARLKLETADPGRYVLLPAQMSKVLDLLAHTPLTALGINRVVHYRASSQAAWHGVGDRLTPKEIWRGFLDEPGMRSLTVEGKRATSPAKHVQIQVAPSKAVDPGVMISFNEHFEVDGAGECTSILADHWQPAQEFFRTLEPHVLNAPPRGSR